jgi:hypothetical protein
MAQDNQHKYRAGWRNNYRASMPLPEVITKDVSFALRDSLKWLGNGGKLPVIVAWPDFPSKKTTLFKLAHKLGFRLTNKMVDNPSVVIYFEDVTLGSSLALKQKYPQAKILNQHCTDISKKRVDEVHLSVFGYNTFINPLEYIGQAVKKSDANALHDGRIIECPNLAMDPNSVYQVLIDNEVDEKRVMDYRMPVVNGKIPLVYKKFKLKEVRFTNDVSYSEIHETSTIINAEEQRLIGEFALAMGADFCELDVLRNKTDNRIYVIDVNKTPYGPPSGLDQKEKAVELLSAAFSGFL